MTRPDTFRIAVLMPVRNAAGTLRESLESLRRQTFRNFRVIAVDDGSSDETAEILAEACRAWSRESPADGPGWSAGPALSRVRLDPGRGIAGALVEAAAGSGPEPFLARQDADDISRPERFEQQIRYLEQHPEIGLLATDIRTVFPGSPSSEPTHGWRRYEDWLAACHTPEEIARNLWVESPLPHPTVIMRREAYERAGGYRVVPWPEDYDLWLRMLRANIRMAKLPAILYDWSDHPGRASRIQTSYTPESFLACRAHHLARFLAGRPVILWGAGRDGRRSARALLREGVGVEAFLDIDPRKIGRRAYGKPILAAEEWLIPPRPASARPMVLAAVGTEGARELIRSRLLAAGFTEGEDFLCIA